MFIKSDAPISQARLPHAQRKLNPADECKNMFLITTSKLGIDTVGRGWHKNVRRRGNLKYSDLSEEKIAAISRKNYEALRWFHGTKDDKNVPSILKNGLESQDHPVNCVSKCYRYAKSHARNDKKRVLRMFLHPQNDSLINYSDSNQQKHAGKYGVLGKGKATTQDPATINEDVDMLFHREMQHDIPDIKKDQSKASLRRHGSFDSLIEPSGWQPFNGEWRPYDGIE